MSKPTKILVVGPSWVGDMVMAQSLFIALKNAFSDCGIDVLASAWSLPLLERMPQIAKGIPMPLNHGELGLLTRFKLGKQLRNEQYNRAIVLPNSWKSALVPFFANIPKRTGFIGESRWGWLNDARRLDKNALPMTVQRFVALGLPETAMQPPTFERPSLAPDKAGQQRVIEKFKLSADGKILALCPGAEYGPSKRWPAAYFAEVAKAKASEGWQVWLFGSAKDKESADTITHLAKGQCLNLVGQTTLVEAIDLMSLAHTVVANDSGLMHLAAALDKKVIAIYGSTPPSFAPPLCASAISVSLNLPCSPCRKRTCPLYPADSPLHTKCLVDITPNRILELISG